MMPPVIWLVSAGKLQIIAAVYTCEVKVSESWVESW